MVHDHLTIFIPWIREKPIEIYSITMIFFFKNKFQIKYIYFQNETFFDLFLHLIDSIN